MRHEWPHRQGWLVCRRLLGRFPSEAAPTCFVQLSDHQGILPVNYGGCEFDKPSLMPLFVAGCGRLQLGGAHLATL